MHVVLVNSPWAKPEIPSLGIGILRASINKILPDAEVSVIDAQLDYIDWIAKRAPFSRRIYNYFSSDTYFHGYGDWIFSSALYDDPEWRGSEFNAIHARSMSKADLEIAHLLHKLSPLFTVEIAERIAELKPDVVGFTTTFQQNTASLAIAKQIKGHLHPQTVTVFGGANCDGPQGAAWHRNFRFIDYVVRGEGEIAFPALLTELSGDRNFSKIPGLCWRSEDGNSHANQMSAKPLLPHDIVAPDYTGFYERFRISAASKWLEPSIPVEGSRGCWWGDKHHCTFCGLNGSFMEFRSKSPARFHEEILDLVRRHRILDIRVVDNIMDMQYLSGFLPLLIEANHDLRIFFEIKSNMRKDQLELLRKSNIIEVQPGIESLSGSILKIMRKGVSGCQNVRMLRDAESLGMTVIWNYLYGFPGELEADYEKIIQQIPVLHHLQPCGDHARIVIERFSPYFNQPELGFKELLPNRQYGLIYDLPSDQLFDLAYTFDAPRQGINGKTVENLSAAIALWRSAYGGGRLVHWDLGSEIVLANSRPNFPWSIISLSDPLHVAAFRLLDQPRTLLTINRKLADLVGKPLEESVDALLEEWQALGLLFFDGDQIVHVATTADSRYLLSGASG